MEIFNIGSYGDILTLVLMEKFNIVSYGEI